MKQLGNSKVGKSGCESYKGLKIERFRTIQGAQASEYLRTKDQCFDH